MTDNEIIKAFECCLKVKKRGDCIDLKCPACVKEGCAYYNRTDEDYEGVIFAEIGKDLLDLINRQRAETEQYRDYNAKLHEKLRECRAEAVKEFAERLKEVPITLHIPIFGLQTKSEIEEHFNEIMLQVRDGIDNLVKEMVGSDEL